MLRDHSKPSGPKPPGIDDRNPRVNLDWRLPSIIRESGKVVLPLGSFKGNKAWTVPFSNSHDYGRIICLEHLPWNGNLKKKNPWISDSKQKKTAPVSAGSIGGCLSWRSLVKPRNESKVRWNWSRGGDEWPCHWIVESIWPQKCWRLCWNLAHI